ncbi:terminase small subunit [Aneurinibacillus aneurinilyticus]|uniref:Terminase small subunit n=1 Tax=Aneurinibacillus aneurinilyticus TaxID=1391 RepID=A0A848D2E1_ANEAE|nr:terminase small subunit [Aneurinibacillus aneurinilyticus]NMF00248.1 terminase small subunit [Aneurinibacillus aneurinilyticus]
MAKLNAKQQAFVTEYLKDFNATQAAIRAGYSEKTARSQGQRLLTNVDIKQLISEKTKDLRQRFSEEAAKALGGLLKSIEDINAQIQAHYTVTARMKAGEQVSDAERLDWLPQKELRMLLKLKSELEQDLLDRAGYKGADKIEHSGDMGLNIVIDYGDGESNE